MKRLLRLCGILGALLMILNLHTIFMQLPDDALQGAIYRIIFIHVPAAINADIFLHRRARHEHSLSRRRTSSRIRSPSRASRSAPC